MVRLPDEFREEFENKGETFFEIAELLYTNFARQYTQPEIADEVDISRQRVSYHLSEMDERWLNRHENQTTYEWNLDMANPVETGLTEAIIWFYSDLRKLFKKHSQTATGTFAIIGFLLLTTSVVMLAFYFAYSLPIVPRSDIPPAVYLIIAVGSFLTGVAMSALSSFQAVVNRIFGT